MKYRYLHFPLNTKETKKINILFNKRMTQLRRWLNSVPLYLIPLENSHHQFLMMTMRMSRNHFNQVVLIILLERILHTLQMRLSAQPISPNNPIRQSLLLCPVMLKGRMNQPRVPVQGVQRPEKGVHERMLHVS
jgi:hypothetical protein